MLIYGGEPRLTQAKQGRITETGLGLPQVTAPRIDLTGRKGERSVDSMD